MGNQRKVKGLRIASKVCWVLGALATGSFIYRGMSRAVPDTTLALVLAVLLSLGLQWVLTMAESAIFDGTLPAFWSVDWKGGGPVPWLVVGAFFCLTIDVILNMGGVTLFIREMNAEDVGPFDASDYVIRTMQVIGTILFSIFVAIGSELLAEFADYIETNPSRHESRTFSNRPETRKGNVPGVVQ